MYSIGYIFNDPFAAIFFIIFFPQFIVSLIVSSYLFKKSNKLS
jgi:hypothetical protein